MAERVPKFSIVTPSYNQSQFIEETIRSVISQKGDFAIEYIVADGGSTDDSVTIIKKYAELLSQKKIKLGCKKVDFIWWSRPDDGQSDALNQGFRKATGDYVAWINSDDAYLPGVFKKALGVFKNNPGAGLVSAGMQEVDENGKLLRVQNPPAFDVNRQIREGNFIPQPSTFMRRRAVVEVGFLNPKYHYAMDYDLWIKIGKKYDGIVVDDIWSRFRLHKNSKTVSLEKKFWKEVSNISRSHGGKYSAPLFKNHYLARYPRLLASLNQFGRAYLLIKNGHYREFGHKLRKNLQPNERK